MDFLLLPFLQLILNHQKIFHEAFLQQAKATLMKFAPLDRIDILKLDLSQHLIWLVPTFRRLGFQKFEGGLYHLSDFIYPELVVDGLYFGLL